MPVYNALPHLEASMASILGQTLGDFELLIRDDASTDGTREALRSWAARDARIRLTEGHERLGLVSNYSTPRARRGRAVARRAEGARASGAPRAGFEPAA